MPHTSYLTLGSNLGDRFGNLGQAKNLLSTKLTIIRESPVYETEPLTTSKCPNQYWHLNQVIEITTVLTPQNLLEHCQQVEQQLGRTREAKYAPRTIDIDILLYDDLILTSNNLTIPHPELAKRNFVLYPLASLSESLIIPGTMSTVGQFKSNSEDPLAVRPFREERTRNGTKFTGRLPDFETVGVYEAVRTFSNAKGERKLFKLEDHMARLLNSASALKLKLSQTPESIRRMMESSVVGTELPGDIRVKIIATKTDIYLILTVLEIKPEIYTSGVAVIPWSGERPNPHIKSLDNRVSHAAYTAAKRGSFAFEALLVDHHGNYTEGSRSNLFVVRDGVLITPGENILEGVTRKLIIHLATENGLTVREQSITESDLKSADEVFMTQTTMGIVPVNEIVRIDTDGFEFGSFNKNVGSITKKLIEAYNQHVAHWISQLTS